MDKEHRRSQCPYSAMISIFASLLMTHFSLSAIIKVNVYFVVVVTFQCPCESDCSSFVCEMNEKKNEMKIILKPTAAGQEKQRMCHANYYWCSACWFFPLFFSVNKTLSYSKNKRVNVACK